MVFSTLSQPALGHSGVVMVLIVRRDEVERGLRAEPKFSGALDVLEDAFRGYGVDHQVVSYRDERTRIQYPPDGPAEKDLWIMPMYVPAIGCAAMRIGAGDDSVIALYDFEYMGIQAMLQDSALASLRAGLPLALAAKHLAKPNAHILACLGGGPDLEVAITATASVLPIDEIRVFATGNDGFATPENAKIARISSAEEAVRGANIVLASVDAAPAVRREWLGAGQLVAAVDWRCAPRASMGDTTVVYASRRHAGVEVGQGIELGEVMRGERPGRQRESEVLFFASQPDIGFIDVATAWWCYRLARQQELGVDVPLATAHATDAAASL